MKIQIFRNTGLIALALTALFLMSASSKGCKPTPGSWEIIGSRNVNYELDKDEIVATRLEGIFTAIQVRVKKSPINMHKLELQYGNGEIQEIDLKNNFAANSESKVIDLPGNKRVIRRAVFWYDTKNISERKGEVE
ncbi:MAG: hypothetical protein H7246_05650, partial [Phycisphaerae bacterium]|nr:hypothetical protein [Saprospiraceae bacterium]